MAKELLTWDEIAQKDEFKALDKAEREKLRNTYFSRAIASRTPTEQLEAARKQFDKDTKPTLLKSIKGAVGDVVERITPDPRDEQPAAAAPAGTRAQPATAAQPAPAPQTPRQTAPQPAPQSPPATTTPGVVQRGLGWAADTGKDAYDMAAMTIGGAVPKIPEATEQAGRGLLRQGMMAAPAMMAAAGGMGHPAAAQAQLDAQRATTPQAVDETMSALPKIQTFEDWSAYGDRVRKDIETQLSPKLKKALDGSKVSGNIFKGEIDFGDDPSVYGYSMQTVSVLGSMVPTLLTLFVTRSPAAAASVGGGMAATEGMDAAREFIGAKTDAELYRESPGFKVLVDKGMPAEQARAIITDKATEASATLQGMVGALGDVATSKLLMGHFDNVINKLGKGKAGRIGVGAAGAGVEGAVTEVAEGVGSDIGIAGQVPTKEIGEDSAEAMVLGALGGTAIGAAGGAMAGSPTEMLGRDMFAQSEQAGPMDPAAADLAARQAMDPSLASGAVAPPGGIPPGAVPPRPQIVPERGPISRAANSGAAAASTGLNPMAIEEDDDGTGLAGPKRPMGIQGIEIPKPADPGKGPAVRPKIPPAPKKGAATGIPGDISQTLNQYSSRAAAKFRTGLDEGAFADLAHRVMWQESRGKVGAVSPKGASGLMQIMPGTAGNPGFGVAPLRDNSPEENMRLGTEYLAAMLNRYDGDVSLALIAYNAGPGTADDVRSGKRRTLPKDTQGYLKTILGGKPPPRSAGTGATTTQETDAQGQKTRVETTPTQPDGEPSAAPTAPVEAQADAVPEQPAADESYPDVNSAKALARADALEAEARLLDKEAETLDGVRAEQVVQRAGDLRNRADEIRAMALKVESAPAPPAPPAASGIKATPATTPAETTPLGLPTVLKPESTAPVKTPKPKTTMAAGGTKAGAAAGTLKSGAEQSVAQPLASKPLDNPKEKPANFELSERNEAVKLRNERAFGRITSEDLHAGLADLMVNKGLPVGHAYFSIQEFDDATDGGLRDAVAKAGATDAQMAEWGWEPKKAQPRGAKTNATTPLDATPAAAGQPAGAGRGAAADGGGARKPKSAPALTPAQQRTSERLSVDDAGTRRPLKKGDTIRLSGDMGYAGPGKDYVVDEIDKRGQVYLKSETGRTSVSPGLIEGAVKSGVTVELVRGARSKQFESYRKAIEADPQRVPAGMLEQIRTDPRLNDGEAEALEALAGKPREGKDPWATLEPEAQAGVDAARSKLPEGFEIRVERLKSLNEKQGKPAKAPSESVDQKPTPAPDAPVAQEEPPAWHTPIPEQGLEVDPKDFGPRSQGYRAITSRVAEDAYDATSKDVLMSSPAMQLYVLPSTADRHGAARLLQAEQPAPAGWQLVSGESIRAGMMTREQAVKKITEMLSNQPVIATNEDTAKPTPKTKPKPRPKLVVDPAKDDILAAIAKLGGVSSIEAKAQGIDPAHFGKRGHLIHRVFTKGGMSFDGMAETLNQYGYPVVDEDGNYTANALLDALSAALDGRQRQISTQGAEAEGERLLENYFADLEAQQSDDWTALDQMDLDDPVSFDAERATNLRLAGVHVMGEDAFDDMAERLAVRFADDDAGYLNALEEAINEAQDQSAARASESTTERSQEEPSGFTLAGESQADLDAKRAADKRAAKEDAARLKAEEDKRRADAALDGFGLSVVETNPEAQKAADVGQQGMDFGFPLDEATRPAATLDAIFPPTPGEALDKDALFDALLDEAFAEATPKDEAPKPKRKPSTRKPKPKPAPTAGEAAASAAQNTTAAFNEAANALLKLFDPGKGTLGAGPVFTDESYAEAKPHFIAMAAHLKDAAADTADLMRAIIEALRDQFGMSRDGVANMKPYIIRFAEDVESGVVNLEGTDVQPTVADPRGDRGPGEGRTDQGTVDAPGAGAAGGTRQDGPATARPGRDDAGRGGVPGAGPAAVGGRGGARVPSQNGKLGDRSGAAGAGERAGGDGVGAGGLSPDAAGATPASQAAVGSSKRVDLAAAAKVAVKPADAANIAESLPQLLEGQQADVLFAEKRFENGGRGVLFTNGTGTGKAQPLDARVLTPEGWKCMGDLSVGDEVISVDGQPTRVCGVYPQGEKPIYRVTFSDGAATECCDEHLWLTQTIYERRKAISNPGWRCAQPEVRSLSEISSSIEKQHFIPIASAVESLLPAPSAIPPYTLGVLLGDGCTRGGSITFSSSDPDVAKEVERELAGNFAVHQMAVGDGRCPAYRIGDNSGLTTVPGGFLAHRMRGSLKDWGLNNSFSFEKFVPEPYLISRAEDRLAVLQGLLDTDGWVDKKTGSAYFCTSSERLAADVISLARSMGGIATRSVKTTASGRPGYTVCLNLPEGVIPFRLGRKASAYRANSKYPPRRRIVSVEPVGIKQAQCIAVDHPSHLYVTDDYIVTHNTFTGLGIVARQVRQGRKNILITVPGENVAASWMKAAKDHFGLSIHRLTDTKDTGPEGSVVITTYANFGANQSLVERQWDMIVHDEAHYLSSSQNGDPTAVLRMSRALTGHPGGAYAYGSIKEHRLVAEKQRLVERRVALDKRIKAVVPPEDGPLRLESSRLQQQIDDKEQELRRRLDEHKANRAELWDAKTTRRLDLSATPFAYHASIDAAEGFLFEYGPRSTSGAYNTPDAQQAFMIEHFGYRMRTGKLNKPDKNVDQGLMERQFNRWLNQSGALSGRMLDVDQDYSRDFVAVDSLVGNKIDDGMNYIREQAFDKESPHQFAYRALMNDLEERFDYHQRVRMLEAIKAPFAVERAKQHIALGRKVVIFHSRIKGGSSHPFRFEMLPETQANAEYNAAVEHFKTNRPDLYNLDLGNLAAPLELFRREFGDRVTFYNGTVKKAEKVSNPNDFVRDDGPYDVIVVQDDAGKEGISLHDTTGKHPRALINIGLPVKPTQAIQIEGRTYRVGQQSDAIFEYFNTGTSFERWTFARKIAERASTAENLAMGDLARRIRDAFVDAFENPSESAPAQGQGKGGKARDRASNAAMTPFQEAKTHYFANQKNTKRRDNREGVDYFATPEPLGLKMVEWAGLRPNESALEPSAGHGAIARYFPENARSTFVEPSGELISRLALRASGTLRQQTFETLDEGANKYDAIVMNPPYGSGGATARDHLAKAMNHLKNGGRIVALIPDGPSANKKIEELLYGKDGEYIQELKEKLKKASGEKAAELRKRIHQIQNFHVRAEIALPSVTFERAGTAVKTHVLIIDRIDAPYDGNIIQRTRNDISVGTIEELFDRIENMGVPDRLEGLVSPQDVLTNFGMKLSEIDGAYDLAGNTFQNKDVIAPIMRKHGGTWNASGRYWTAKSDPSSDLARALQGLPVEGLIAEPEAAPTSNNPDIIEHTTQKGKVIRGVVRRDMTLAQAKEIDPYTFKKDGGFFIREVHLGKLESARDQGEVRFSRSQGEYPRAGAEVDGRTVIKADAVPNMDSIDSTLDDYTILDGLREVPVGAFESLAPRDMFYASDDIRRVEQLAERIKASGEISPLIVVVDAEGPYILEGAHRAAALHLLGAKSFPAVVVTDDSAESIQFSRTETPSRANLTQSDIRAAIAPMVAAWKTPVQVEVLPSVTDPATPEAVRTAHAKLGEGDVVDGVYYRGTVYLFSDAIQSEAHAAEVLMHEALGHLGLRGAFGPALVGVLDNLIAARRSEVIAKAKAYGLDPKDRNQLRQAAEEVLAELAQSRPELGFVKRAIAAIRQWLRENIHAFRDLMLTDSEIIARYIVPARAFVEEGSAQQVESERAHGNSIKFKLAEDSLAKEFDSGETVTLYRAMALIDGKLYPPMSAKMTDESGKLALRNPEPVGKWQRSEEKPEAVPTEGRYKGQFPLKKPGGGTTWALYAPYFHASPLPLNDQFTAAYLNDGVERPQIVTVEVEVPASEITSGYQAQGSVKKVGPNKWNSGVVASKVPGGREVFLSRYLKIKRIVPDAEVAQKIAAIVNPNRLQIPENVVTPQLRAELEKQGVRIAKKGTRGDDIRFSRRTPPPADPLLEEARRKSGRPARESYGTRMRRVLSQSFVTSKAERDAAIDAGRQGMLDQFHGIKRAEQRNLGNLPVEQSAYVTARLANGISSVMRAVLLHGAPQWAANGQHLVKKPNTQGLLDILAPVADDLDSWLDWMIGNRARRLMDEGRENLFTEAEINRLIASGDGKEAQFRKVSREFAAFKRSILDVAEQAGLIDPESRATWDHADWIPFYRQMEATGQTLAPRSQKALANQSSGIRQLKGGTSALNDPIENIVLNFHHLLDASLKNNAVRKSVKAAGEGVVERVGMEFKKRPVPRSEIKRELIAQGMPKDIVATFPGEVFDGISRMWSMQPPTDKDVIRVMEGGKPAYYRVLDPLLLKAVTSYEAYAWADVPGMAAARAAKRILTQAVTATPEFMLRNYIRDTASTAIISKSPVAAAGAIKGIVKAYRESGGAEHMLFAGASFASGYIEGGDTEAVARSVRRSLRRRGMNAASVDGFMASLIDTPAKLWEQYRRMGEAIENANREAVFEAVVKRGGSVTEAAYEAKDLMDFSLRGGWAGYNLLADVIPFFNARVQGLYRLGRTDPKQLAVRGAVMLTLPTLLLAFANLDNDEYEELADWDKDTYWHIFVGGEHFRIPKPFEVGLIFGTIPERAFHALAGDDEAKKFVQRATWGLVETFNLGFMPQLLAPLYEVATNRDTFRGTDIENMGDEAKLPHLRYGGRTSPTLRELLSLTAPVTDPIGLSPKRAQHLIEGYLGTMGAWGIGIVDAGTRLAIDEPDRPAMRPDDMPLLRVLYRGPQDIAPRSTQFINDIYDAAREYSKIDRSVKTLMKEGKDDAAMRLMERHRERLTLGAPMAKTAEMLSKLNKRMDAIYQDRTLSPQQKRVMLDELLGQRAELARSAVEQRRMMKAAM